MVVNGFQDSIGHGAGRFARRVRHQDKELFPAIATHNIDFSDSLTDEACRGLKNVVPEGVTIVIVHRFEIVNI